MTISRRHLALAAIALRASAQKPKLVSKAYNFPDLPVKRNAQNTSRAVFNGETTRGFPIEMHETELAPGLAPHPPHHHVHEELLLLREGTLEVNIAGKITTIGPGSVIYITSGEEHGWKNTGTTTVHYGVIALGGD